MTIASLVNRLGISVHPALNLVHYFNGAASVPGRGVCATEAIPAGTELCRVPVKGAISVEYAADSEFIQWVRAKVVPQASPLAGMLLVVAHEIGRGTASPWHFYFALLPSLEKVLQQETPLMLFSDEEAQILDGTLAGALVEGEEALQARFERTALPWMLEGVRRKFIKRDMATLEWFKYISWILQSRGFSLGDNVGDGAFNGLFLIPAIDMLNHQPEPFNHTLLNHPVTAAEVHCGTAGSVGAPAFRLVAQRDISSGEQVFSFYGQLSNAQLLQNFGFIDGRGTEHDAVAVSSATVREALEDAAGDLGGVSPVKARKRLAQIAASGLVPADDSRMFICQLAQPAEPELLAALVAFAIDDTAERLEYLEMVRQELPSGLGALFWSDMQSEAAFLLERVFAVAMERRCAATLAHDARLLQGVWRITTNRTNLALSYRRIEERLFLQLIAKCAQGEIFPSSAGLCVNR